MEYEKLRSAAEVLVMPDEMKRRIVRNCRTQTRKIQKEDTMKTNKIFRKPAVVFAALAVCLSLSVTAVAASGALKGYFRDIMDHGAVVGTSYEQATDEIRMSATVNGDGITVLVTFADPRMMPYSEAEKLGIAAYKIVGVDGRTVEEGSSETVQVIDGQAAVDIPLNGIGSGSYRLIVTAFVTEKKADQPLNFSGNWECAFTK